MRMPSSWHGAEVYRACGICIHGRTATGQHARTARQDATHCICPAVTGGRSPVATAQARANHGPCGPEAHHQDFPGLHEAPLQRVACNEFGRAY